MHLDTHTPFWTPFRERVQQTCRYRSCLYSFLVSFLSQHSQLDVYTRTRPAMFSDNVYILFDAHVAREDRDCVPRRIGLLCEIRFRDVNVKSNIEAETERTVK